MSYLDVLKNRNVKNISLSTITILTNLTIIPPLYSEVTTQNSYNSHNSNSKDVKIKNTTSANTPHWNKLEATGKIALRKINTAVGLPTKAPVLTHKAYCSKCNRDSFISWSDYPDVGNKQLGCSICKTQIEVSQAYSINKHAP